MDDTPSGLSAEMNRTRSALACDLCALALTGEDGRTLRWKFAAGNLNDRCLKMVDPPGRGLSGSVAKVGRPMTLQTSELERARKLHEYPIFISELLRSAHAVPLLQSGKVGGVLLIGDRTNRSYKQEELLVASACGERIIKLLAQQSEPSSTRGTL